MRLLEVEGEQRAGSDGVEGERQRVRRAPERVLDPGRLPPAEEVRLLDAEIHQERAIGEHGGPRDPYVGRRRRQAERPALLDERHERGATRDGLRWDVVAGSVETLGEERQ